MIRLLTVVAVLAILFSGYAFAQSPPYSSITITGETEDVFNKVCLFKSGGAKIPLKTGYLSSYDGSYRMKISIPSDMVERDNYYFTDMRFWGDDNSNNKRDSGEMISACHFIIWVPDTQELFMQIYQGEKIPIESSTLEYDYFLE